MTKFLKLKIKVNEKSNIINWKDLKLGLSKNKIQTSFGHPDRKGKFSNGEEFWGFQDYTLKFDKNGFASCPESNQNYQLINQSLKEIT